MTTYQRYGVSLARMVARDEVDAIHLLRKQKRLERRDKRVAVKAKREACLALRSYK